ncbi:MAG TPA: MMPL family transporter [Solimonas sp.]
MKLTADTLLSRIEPLIYTPGGRRLTTLLLALATALFAWQAAGIRPDAGFDKTVPADHPYMQVFEQYRAEFGGANTTLVALMQDSGDIYNAEFLDALRTATGEVFFIDGMDRARVSSIFTRNVRYIEVVDGGFAAGDVIPAHYAPSEAMFAQIRENVGKAGVIGRLVSSDQRGAMVFAEVLERSPVTRARTDYLHVAHSLENNVRGRLTSPTRWPLKLKAADAPFAQDETVATLYRAPTWRDWLFGVEVRQPAEPGAEPLLRRYHGWQWTTAAEPNPQYLPGLSVHIIGFATVVGDVTDAALEVGLFFLLTVLATMLALWGYLGSLRLAWLPLACSLVAVVWEFGLLKTFGFGLDPFAILVPFLVLAVSTSHGVQYVNTWADRIAQGDSSFEASRATFRRLFVPGTIALLTNVAGFLTLQLVPIGSIREMSFNACFGMLAVIVTNKLMMPIWLSRLRLDDVRDFQERRARSAAALDPLWQKLAVITERPVAIALLLLSLLVLAGSWWLQDRRIVGDAQAGVPELRPDSRYNRDVDAITAHFAIGTDVLKVVAEAWPWACIEHDALEQLDRFTWHMQNTQGVSSARSLAPLARRIYSGLWEVNPKFEVIPRNHDGLVLSTKGVETSTGLLNVDCSAMPVFVFTADHRATTIDHIAGAVEAFNRSNAEEFYAQHPQADPQACADDLPRRRAWGLARTQSEDLKTTLRGQGLSEEAIAERPAVQALRERIDALAAERAERTTPCPLHFALASGNVGVMGATNAVVHEKELPAVLWVYAVIGSLLLISYRSGTALAAICLPLFMVSIFANALMAAFGIGLKVATLPVVTLAVGIGVDYGIYIYDVLQDKVREGLKLRDAYLATLRQTGKAVVFTGLCLAGGVAAWLFSDLQFQRDMGQLLVFMFTANMLGAVLLLPAVCRLLMRETPRT